MTAVNLLWGPASIMELGAQSSYPLDDADNAIAYVFCASKDGVINAIGLRPGAVTGNPPAYNVGLVTVSNTTGDPTTTAFGGSSAETFDFTNTDFVWITLNTPATVNAGDIIAVKVWPTASAPDGSNNAAFARTSNYAWGTGSLPRCHWYTTAWITAVGMAASWAVRYSDGDVYGPANIGYASALFDSADTPDEIGARFSVPTAMTCRGARITMYNPDGNAPFDIILYDADDNVIATLSVVDEDRVFNATVVGHFDVFWQPVGLTADATYRLTIKPTSSSLQSRIGRILVDSAPTRTKNIFIPEAARWQLTERTNGGAWTDTDTGLPWFALHISDITFAGGAGGTRGFVFAG